MTHRVHEAVRAIFNGTVTQDGLPRVGTSRATVDHTAAPTVKNGLLGSCRTWLASNHWLSRGQATLAVGPAAVPPVPNPLLHTEADTASAPTLLGSTFVETRNHWQRPWSFLSRVTFRNTVVPFASPALEQQPSDCTSPPALETRLGSTTRLTS